MISEILINSQEHSSTKYFYVIGYFSIDSKQNGIFQFSIFNFGKTIYQKFKDLPEKTDIKKRMIKLTKKCEKNQRFNNNFHEETLWTLLALQEGVTTKEEKRGNGTITFIKNFFEIKGDSIPDDISKMVLISGNTHVVFDGTYSIFEKRYKKQFYKAITFNKEGKFTEPPDINFVKSVRNGFPGTLISTKIYITNKTLLP